MDECTVAVSGFDRERLDLDGGRIDVYLTVPVRMRARDEVALRGVQSRSEAPRPFIPRRDVVVIVRGVGVRA